MCTIIHSAAFVSLGQELMPASPLITEQRVTCLYCHNEFNIFVKASDQITVDKKMKREINKLRLIISNMATELARELPQEYLKEQ